MNSLAQKDQGSTTKEFIVTEGKIQQSVSATGNVQPQNRLEIKPPVGGRIEKILVQEGQIVKTGDILAMMSSTERAALLDAARLQNGDLSRWEDVYKPTAVIAPIDGEVIVKAVNPGQTVTPTDSVIVLSDRLIVQAQVDETDIGRIKLGQEASITLDAYPDIFVKGKVNHIYYESKLVSNVIIYAVDILPETVPEVFRSGMSANVQIIEQVKENILILPKEAVKKRDGKNSVLVKRGGSSKGDSQDIEVGVSDDSSIEIMSGLKAGDVVINYTRKALKKSGSSSSPFMPQPPNRAR